MPNWTDENGYSWFNKLECKRCLDRFDTDERGEIPEHDCLDGRWKSESVFPEHHMPVFVSSFKLIKNQKIKK